MRAFKGVNLKTILDPAVRQALASVDAYSRQTGRALTKSVAKGQTPQAIVTTPAAPGAGGGTPGDVVDTVWAVKDDFTPSKRMRFECAGISPSTTRILFVPNADGTIALSADVAPFDAKYIVQQPSSGLSAEQALGDLATGLLKNTTSTGVLSIAGAADLPAHASRHDSGGADAMAADAAAGTPSLRSIGTTAVKACAGNDTRLSDARTPTAHATSHNSGGADVMAIDSAAGTGSLRTLGSGATQACGGTDTRLADARVPTSHDHTKHDNRARRIAIPIGCWEINAKSNSGTEPNVISYVSFLTGASTYTHVLFQVPPDYVSGAELEIWGSSNGADVSDMSMKVYTKKLVGGTTSTLATYDNLNTGTIFPNGTAIFAIANITISTSLAAGDYIRLTVERDGVGDGNPNTLRFHGGSFLYTADM